MLAILGRYRLLYFNRFEKLRKKVFERLKEQDIFVVPLSNAIRVALAAITELEIIGLPTKIKREIEKA